MPSWSFRSRFAPHHDQWLFICRHHHVILLLAVLQQWSLYPLFGWFDTSHYYCQVQNLQSKVHVEESTYWFVKTRAIRWSTVVKAIPSCGGDPFLHRHVQELHASTTSLISDFGCIFFFLLSLVLSINSPNATSLHSRCIWEGVLRYKSQEVKGSLVFSYSRVWVLSCTIYISLGLVNTI